MSEAWGSLHHWTPIRGELTSNTAKIVNFINSMAPDGLLSGILEAVRAQNVSDLARSRNVDRRGVYKALTATRPTLAGTMEILDLLDLEFRVRGFDAIAEPFNVAFASDDPDRVIATVADALRAHGVAPIAKRTGLDRTRLYRFLRDRTAIRLESILKIIDALGLEIYVRPRTYR